MATLENIFMTVCIWGLIIVLAVTFIAIAVALIGLTVQYLKTWRSEDGK